MNSNFRNFAIWIAIALLLIALFNLFQNSNPQPRANEIAYSQLLTEVEAGRVQKLTIAGKRISGTLTNGDAFETYAPDDARLVDRLYDKGVEIEARPPDQEGMTLLSVLISWFPMLLLIGVWIFFMNQHARRAAKAVPWALASLRPRC